MRTIRFAILFFLFATLPALALAADSGVNVIQFGATFHIGESGTRVIVLQKLLASDPNIYPEGLVTGYYGPLTTAAVKRLQEKNGLEQVGNVGPLTLAVINKWLLKDQELSSANIGMNESDAPNSGSSAAATSQTSSIDFSTTCTVVKSGVTMTMQWPKGIPCPKGDDVVTTMPAPQPSANTAPQTTQTQTQSSTDTKTCQNPLASGTISWPASLPCPGVQMQGVGTQNTQSTQTQTQPVTQQSQPQSASQPQPADSSTLAQYGITPPKLTDTTSCLGKLFSTESVTLALSNATQCPAQTLSMSDLPADQAADKKICTLNINGSVLSFPFPTNYPCPMQATEGVPVGSAAASNIGNSVNWNDLKSGITGTTCTIRVNGQDLVFPWPSNVACTGSIPGVQ